MQDQQSVSMKKRRLEKIKVLQPGTVVLVIPEPDQKANCGTKGILGIAYSCTGNGSASIVTEHGILISKSKVLSLPHDKYIIVKQNAPLYGRLMELRNEILENKFEPSQQATISIAKCCIAIYGGRTGLSRCKCLPSRGCKGSCGCVREGLPCSSQCRCNGSCHHTTDLEKIKEREKRNPSL
jgi:hypothetical protein